MLLEEAHTTSARHRSVRATCVAASFPATLGRYWLCGRACARPGRPRLPQGEPRPIPCAHQAGQPDALPGPTCWPLAGRPILADAGGVRAPSDPRGRPALSRRTSHVSPCVQVLREELPGGSLSRLRREPWGLVGRSLRIERAPRPCERGLGAGCRPSPHAGPLSSCPTTRLSRSGGGWSVASATFRDRARRSLRAGRASFARVRLRGAYHHSHDDSKGLSPASSK